MFDELKPIFYISDDDKKKIEKINSLLKNIEIKDTIKKNNLKAKSRVKSIHSSLAIEANSLSLNDNKIVLGKNKGNSLEQN